MNYTSNSYQYPIFQSQDFSFKFQELQKQIDSLKEENALIKKFKEEVEEDWDNAMLMQKWNISKRTTANYRKSGLAFYKRGGRIYYTNEARETFKKFHH